MLFLVAMLTAFLACEDPNPIIDEPFPEIDTNVVPFNRDTMDTIVPVIVPDFFTTGRFSKIEFEQIGDYLLLTDSAGKQHRFYCGFLSTGSDLINNEKKYTGRTVTIGWKKERHYEEIDDQWTDIDSVVTMQWSGFTKTIGKNGDYPTAASAFSSIQEGDTLEFLPGEYRLRSSLELWGVRNVVVTGPADQSAQLICEDQSANVFWIVNSQNITIQNLHCTHEQPAEGESCTGNVIALDHAVNIDIKNSNLNGCGAVGLWAFSAERVRLTNNWIHDNTLWSVLWDGVGLMEATDEYPDLVFEGNKIEDNGLLNPLFNDTID